MPDSQVQPSGDETTTSLTQTIGTQQDRFQELEAAIRNQNSSIKAHQTEFAAVHKRFDGLESRVLNTMEFCQTSSQNILELRQETSANLLAICAESAATIAEFRNSFAAMTAQMQQLQSTINEATQRSDSSHSSSSDAMSEDPRETTTEADADHPNLLHQVLPR